MHIWHPACQARQRAQLATSKFSAAESRSQNGPGEELIENGWAEKGWLAGCRHCLRKLESKGHRA